MQAQCHEQKIAKSSHPHSHVVVHPWQGLASALWIPRWEAKEKENSKTKKKKKKKIKHPSMQPVPILFIQ